MTKEEKLNRKLMDENITLKGIIEDQLKLILSMRSRKSKAHRRLVALRDLNRHVQRLQLENALLHESLHNADMRQRRIIESYSRAPHISLWQQIFGGN